MSFAKRNADLLRILEIEEQIKDIEHANEYLKIRKRLKMLENPRRKGMVIINAPDSTGDLIELRKNSSDERLIIAEYREMIRGDVEKIRSLIVERLRLRDKLQEGRFGNN